jgi:hypothetical protein
MNLALIHLPVQMGHVAWNHPKSCSPEQTIDYALQAASKYIQYVLRAQIPWLKNKIFAYREN